MSLYAYEAGSFRVAVKTGQPSDVVQVGTGRTWQEALSDLSSTPIQSTGRDRGVGSALRWAEHAGWIDNAARLKKVGVDLAKHQHATRKSPAQLQREINEALAKPARHHAANKQSSKAWYVFYLPEGRKPKSFGGKSGWDWPKAYFGPYASRDAATSAVRDEMAAMDEAAARYKIRHVTPQEFKKLWGQPAENTFVAPWSASMKR